MLVEQRPCHVQHLLGVQVHVDGQKFLCVVLCIVQATVVVVCQVETVLQLCLCVGGIGIQTDGSVHHLGMVLAGLLACYQLLQTRQRTEGVYYHLAHIAVAAQIQLALGDVTRVVGHGMGDVATAQCGYGNDGDGTATYALGELHGLLVDLGQVGVQRTGHGVLGRNLVHTVAYDRQRVGIRCHVGEQYQHGLMLLHGKVLGCGKCHVGNEQSLHGRVLGGVDEGYDSVQRTCIGEGVAEEVIVIVGHTHTAQDDLVGLGAHGHHSHHLVEGLVGVGEEGDLLTGHQGVVQVDTCNTGGDEFAGLLTAHGVH